MHRSWQNVPVYGQGKLMPGSNYIFDGFLTASLLRGSSRYFVVVISDTLLKNHAKAKLAVVANSFACSLY